MNLYLSNSTTINTPQLEVERSLGGYISSTPLRNNNIGNIFSDLVMSNNGQPIVECKAVFLKNIFPDTKNNIYLYYDYPTNPNIKLEIGVVLPNSAGGIEKIQSSDSTPLFSTFVEANGIANKMLIANSLTSLSSIGIWLKRTLLTTRQETDVKLFDVYSVYRPVLDKLNAGLVALTSSELAIYDNWNNQVDSINFLIQFD